MDERQRYAQGMTVRRAVLGDAHVDASLKNRDELTKHFRTCSRATPGEKSGAALVFPGRRAA
jgi:hypothetical protein